MPTASSNSLRLPALTSRNELTRSISSGIRPAYAMWRGMWKGVLRSG